MISIDVASIGQGFAVVLIGLVVGVVFGLIFGLVKKIPGVLPAFFLCVFLLAGVGNSFAASAPIVVVMSVSSSGAITPLILDNMQFVGEWADSYQYEAQNVVSYQGAGYVALAPSIGIRPIDDPNTWAVLVAAGLPGPVGPQGPQGVAGPAGSGGPFEYQGSIGDMRTGEVFDSWVADPDPVDSLHVIDARIKGCLTIW